MKLILWLLLKVLIMLMLLIGWYCDFNGDSQSSQNSKFAISLQYLKKEVRNGAQFFLHVDKHQRFYKLALYYLIEVPKIEIWQYFSNIRKKYRNCFFVLFWGKTFRSFMESHHGHCFLFLGGCGQKWIQPFRS